MNSLVFESKPNYYYKVIYRKDRKLKDNTKVGQTKRISKKEYEKEITRPSYNGERGDIRVGDMVEIIVKPYHLGKKVRGKIKKILTNKKIHTRGHKVMLEDGTVGRMIRLIQK